MQWIDALSVKALRQRVYYKLCLTTLTTIFPLLFPSRKGKRKNSRLDDEGDEGLSLLATSLRGTYVARNAV